MQKTKLILWLVVAVLVAGCAASPAGTPAPSPTRAPGAAAPGETPPVEEPPGTAVPAADETAPVRSGASPTPRAARTAAPGHSPEPSSTPGRPPRVELPVISPVPLTPGEVPAQGEVPDGLLQAMIADAAGQAGVSEREVEVVQARAVVWRDGSLGCPQPGMFYTQALVSGYQVILRAGGREYDYHASASGAFFVCENGRQSPPLEISPGPALVVPLEPGP